MSVFDVIIVGGGPAGLAAGIRLAAAGWSVVVLERSESAPDGPGETLHPGIEPVFEQLGVAPAVRAAATCRHPGLLVNAGSGPEFVPYGGGEDWRGFQIRRQALNRILGHHLCSLGGVLRHACLAIRLGRDQARHVVGTGTDEHRARWLIDASGTAGWLDRRARSTMAATSAPIWLRYGYWPTSPEDGELPQLTVDAGAWSWMAPLGDGETAWVAASPRRAETADIASRGADGTWRLSEQPAGAGFFRVGDAACRLDPSNGHGVLRALMSATLAAHLLVSTDNGAISEDCATDIYSAWIRRWFLADAAELRRFAASARLSRFARARSDLTPTASGRPSSGRPSCKGSAEA